ncbi:hypothetical protein TrLO_g15994 [Triparma laevis f. longispina]|nr:hypothetical protein TrLO_g15994 [Triparma laevis f. longispina]
MILKVCKREDVKVEDVLEKGGFIREIKKQGTKEVMESLAVLAEKDENTRRTFRRWFEHADEGILLPLGEGLPRLLSAIDVRNDERWGRKAKECYQSLKSTSPSSRSSCLLLIPILLSVDPTLSPELFSTCVDVLTTLSTTPQNYPTLTLCLQQMLNCLEIMDGHMAVETVKKVMHSPKLVHALSSVLTFPVTTARKGEERVGRKKTRKGWGEWSYMEEERFEERKREGVDLSLGALGSSDPKIASGALSTVSAALSLWSKMSHIGDTGVLAAAPPGHKGELDVTYDADAVAEVRNPEGHRHVFDANYQNAKIRPRGSTLGLIANYTLGSEIVKGAWNVIKGVMNAGGVSVADLVDVKVLVEGVKDALNSERENCEAVDFLKSAVEGNYDVSALILSDPKICSVLLWSPSTPLRVASSCASIIATVWESPPQSALSSCVPSLRSDPSIVSTLIDTVVDPLPENPDHESGEEEIEEYATICDLKSAFVAHSPLPSIFVPLESACRLLFKDTEMARRTKTSINPEEDNTGEQIAYEISQRLRLRLLTVALATVNATGVSSIVDDDGVRSRMVTVCCSVLSSSAVSSYSSSSMDMDMCEDKKIDSSSTQTESIKLFEITVALLTSLLPSEEGPYAREYVHSIKRGSGVENMLRWVGAGEGAWNKNSGSPEGTKAVVNFLHTASASSADVALHLNVNVGVCRALCNGLGGYKNTCEHRGYVVVLKNDEKGGLGGELSYKKSFVEDPSFGVWIDVIKAVSCAVSAAGDNPTLSIGAVEFLCQYAELFLKCLDSAIPTNKSKFTVQGLLEISAICDLLSVLAESEEGWKRVKEMGGVGDRLIASVINVTRDLCCFLGSSVIARQILGSSGQTPTSRHEAISYAHSASSSILAVTLKDQSEAAVVAGGPRAAGNAFDSVFHRKIEELASNALLNCVAAVTRSHPANRSYVGFTVEDSSMLDLTSCVNVGSMVGVRFGGGSGVGGGEQFGEVVGKNDKNNTIDVRFGDSVDSNIPAFRVCGVEDSALRKPVLNLSSGGNGVDEIWKGALCIGHLGLAVRWCKGFWLNSENRGKAGLDIKGLSERLVVLLACELGLGAESYNLVVGADEKLCMMIFSLFGDGGANDRRGGGGGKNNNTSSSGPIGGVFGSGMQALIGRDCLELISGGNPMIEFFKQGVAVANAEALSPRGLGAGAGGGVGGGAGRSRSASSIGGIWDLV